ncbi:MAG: GNAT family N-acetyltransferase [Methyloceanibacter sp.]|nr:GNAT family N-acetyltransferase [Methyloceanibacter sp.]
MALEPVFESFRNIVDEAISPLAFAPAEPDQAAHLNDLGKPDRDGKFFVAQIGEEIVGFMAVSLDEAKKTGEIGLNAVHQSHAGQGLGTRLNSFAIAIMRNAGMRLATMGTGGDPSHAPARRIYEKVGFGAAIPSVWLYKLL